jgi:hypothetical protein
MISLLFTKQRQKEINILVNYDVGCGCGVVCGVVWCVVWCGVVWCGVVWWSVWKGAPIVFTVVMLCQYGERELPCVNFLLIPEG